LIEEGEFAVANEDGIIVCGDLNCEDVWDNPFTDENGDGILDNDDMDRIHGESWCEYGQAKVGYGYDFVGSAHYLHTCSGGEEIVMICSGGEGYRDMYCSEEKNQLASGKMISSASCVKIPDCSDLEEDMCVEQRGCEWVAQSYVTGFPLELIPYQVDDWDALKSDIRVEFVNEDTSNVLIFYADKEDSNNIVFDVIEETCEINHSHNPSQIFCLAVASPRR